MKQIATVCVILSLVGCGLTDPVYDKLADLGNRYCERNSGVAANAFKSRVNRKLREAAADFEVKIQIVCDKSDG